MNYEIYFPKLGRLNIFEVYEFYDKPVLFACRNELDHLFLAVLVEDKEESETWLYVGVSQRRFQMVRSGGIDLHDAFAKSETEHAFLVNIPSNKSSSEIIEEIPVTSLLEDYFPQPGEYLQLKTETLPRIRESVNRKAKQSNRVHVKLHFDFENQWRSEAPAKFLGNVLQTLQDVLNSIGQALKEDATERGIIPRNILSNNEMLVEALGSGSFEIDLASTNHNNLMKEADVEDTVEELVKLIAIGNEVEPLKKELEKLKIRVASNYLNFLEAISNDTDQMEIEWASPRENREGKAKISSLTARSAIGIIQFGAEAQTHIEEVMGVLVGANLRSHIYELEVNENKKYMGKISPEAMTFVEGAVLGRMYKATINIVETLKPTTGDEKIKYELISLEMVATNLPNA